MGRHSSNEQFRYYRSIVGWFVPWALVGVVAVTAVWIAIGALGRDDLETRPPGGAAAQGPEEPGPGSPESASEPSPSPSAAQSPTPEPEQPQEEEPEEPKQDKPKPELISEGVSVQVLNGTSSSVAGRAMASRLTRLGFDVVVTFPSTPYNYTTVLWSSGGRPAAKALAARFEWRSAPKPDNLSPSVDLHVVVGADEA